MATLKTVVLRKTVEPRNLTFREKDQLRTLFSEKAQYFDWELNEK
jgi:hypothetical protein